MADIIKMMSDALANQIAAGEVIQRPASVVKELVENSVDAGATKITVNIKDAGRTLIQVTDNGCGMSENDARMSFERHATSKINTADDLFCIYTKGFRGEALASIAAVAEVELKTRREEDVMGTDIIINGANFVSQTPCNTPKGTNFAVKSLFFNVPARRKFLKANSTELQHIITEFQRVVLTHPQIEFSLYHNDNILYQLPKANLKQRIISVFGKSLNSELIPVEIDTSIVKITGFTGKPSTSKKKSDKQFFFVNNRFMKNSYFNKAIALAYDKLVLPDCVPAYFLYFDIDPHTIDVNIHPTKTEINFENASDIFRLLQAGIRETLSKSDVAPSIDFDNDFDSEEVPYFSKDIPAPQAPQVNYNPFYNPFEHESNTIARHNAENWEKLYNPQEDTQVLTQSYTSNQQTMLGEGFAQNSAEQKLIQIKNKYIISPVKSGLMVIDQSRAHYRILYEKYISAISENADGVQTLLYPETINIDTQTFAMAYDIREELASVGFDIEYSENILTIIGIPPFLNSNNAIDILKDIIDSYKNENTSILSSIKETLAKTIARCESIPYGKPLAQQEMQNLIDNLFASSSPNYTPDGKPAVVIMQMDEIDKKFI
mgnify:CR=1 FL=1